MTESVGVNGEANSSDEALVVEHTSKRQKSLIIFLSGLVFLLMGLVVFFIRENESLKYQMDLVARKRFALESSKSVTCFHEGQAYQVGERYTTYGDVCNSCLCNETGEWTCAEMACESDEGSPKDGPMSDWKTYKNHGYQIQFPASMTIQSDLSGPANKLTVFSDDQHSFSISVPVQNSQSLDEYSYYLDTESSGETMVADNIPAKVFELANGYCDAGTCGDPMYVVVTENKGVFYEILFHGDNVLSELEGLILSTFEFTDNE